MTECPFCNGLLGPGDFLPGKGAVCPTCGNRVAPAVRARAVTAPPQPPLAPGLLPPLPEDDGEPSPFVPTRPPAEVEDEPEPPVSFLPWLRHLDGGTLAAFVVGSVALLLASVPFLSVLTKPLSVLAVLIGLVAGAVHAALGGRGHAWPPLLVAALNLLIVLFVGAWPRGPAPPAPPRVAISLKKGGTVAYEPVADSDWVDAGTSAVRLHDLRVQVVGVRVGGVEIAVPGKKVAPSGATGRLPQRPEGAIEPPGREKKIVTPDRYLVIRLRVTYEGVVFQQLPYESWADLPGAPSKHEPTLTDNLNHAYAQKTFDPSRKLVGRGDRLVLTPGREVDEVLVYPVPPAGVDYLRLQLPASAFGGTGEIRFQIPRSMIATS